LTEEAQPTPCAPRGSLPVGERLGGGYGITSFSTVNHDILMAPIATIRDKECSVDQEFWRRGAMVEG
jgi:hypothetical protein